MRRERHALERSILRRQVAAVFIGGNRSRLDDQPFQSWPELAGPAWFRTPTTTVPVLYLLTAFRAFLAILAGDSWPKSLRAAIAHGPNPTLSATIESTSYRNLTVPACQPCQGVRRDFLQRCTMTDVTLYPGCSLLLRPSFSVAGGVRPRRSCGPQAARRQTAVRFLRFSHSAQGNPAGEAVMVKAARGIAALAQRASSLSRRGSAWWSGGR
jgi:hypothetical protein